ncbi:ABC transporter permease [Pseudoxanthomonas mexicana]
MKQATHSGFLFRQLLARELAAKYKSTTLGVFWYIAQPLLMLAVYTAVFSGIFKVRWPGVDNSATFALMLFAGLIIFNLFSEVLTTSPGLVTGQPNYVKKVVFPLEILSVVRVAAAVVTALVSLIVLLAAQWLITGHVGAWFLTAPVVLASLFPLLLAISWLVASLGVYLRDVGQLVGLIASVFLFISPIFFPATAIPAEMRFLVAFNPLVGPIEQLRAVTLRDVAPDVVGLFYHFAIWSVVAFLVLKVFRRLAKGFADVI